jgi:MYXO-CTERM domain-containing protein
MNRPSPLVRSLLVVAMGLAAMVGAHAAGSLLVPGDANPWLAGMPDGTSASGIDSAPDQSPVLVDGMVAGSTIRFVNVSGAVSYTGECPALSCYGPDGDVNASEWGYDTRETFGYGAGENGLAVVRAPITSLLGVFVGAEQPDQSPTPPLLDFQSSAIGLDFVTLSPGLKQVFFIGDGLTSGGLQQSFIVPDGATRLYLGTMDGFGWTGNNGAFAVDVSVVPEPASWALALAGLAVVGSAARRRAIRG